MVNQCLKITQWWETLGVEWQGKFTQLPFTNVSQNGLCQLIKVPLDQINQWWEQINSFNKERGYLCPEDIGKVAELFIPKKKTCIKLEEPVTDDDFSLVAKKYKFTSEELQEFKEHCAEFADEEEIVTEHLLTILEENFERDPLKILSRNDRYEWRLQKKQEELDQVLAKFEKHSVEIAELKQQVAMLTALLQKIQPLVAKANTANSRSSTKTSSKPKGFGTSAKSQS